MSRARVGAAVLIAAALAARIAGAQSAGTRALTRRADSLLALWRDASTLAEVQLDLQAARQHTAGEVTRSTASVLARRPVQTGHLMVIATEPDSIPLRAAVASVWTALERTYGRLADSLTARPLRLSVVSSDRRPVTNPDDRRVAAGLSVDELVRTLLGMVGQPLTDARFSRWLGGRVQVMLDTGLVRSAAYLELAAGSRAGRACFAGVPAQCAAALELDEDSTFFLTAYDANDRRQAVMAARRPDMVEPAEQALYRQCVDRYVDSACAAFLGSLGREWVPRPLTEDARDLLVATALDLGGPEAYGRLMADSTAPVSARLARAAGVPAAVVVARWRAGILAARPAGHGIPWSGTLATLGWVALLATAAVRSTRWRLG